MLIPFHRTKEDEKITRSYESVLDIDPNADISQCIRNGIIIIPESNKKRGRFSRTKKLIQGQCLEEKLFQCVTDWENTKTREDKKAVDLKALEYIKRCCKGELSFIKEGIRFYRDIQNGVFYISEPRKKTPHFSDE